MKQFLAASEYINWNHPDILGLAKNLSKNKVSLEAIATACFEFVRDEIKHSVDYQLNPVTCKASDVLKHKTGYCYAKSHLLAALLRANQIPAGLCYQQLRFGDENSPFCLHGLNAIWLEEYGWYRVDARGNKEGVDAQFCPPNEQLAYGLSYQGECDLPEVWAEPLPEVIEALQADKTWDWVQDHLPALTLLSAK